MITIIIIITRKSLMITSIQKESVLRLEMHFYRALVFRMHKVPESILGSYISTEWCNTKIKAYL